ncbi:MAG: hypothetical protein ABMB14_28820 [Myxococcota bacterium]
MVPLLLSAAALASPLNPWGSATGEDTALINPYLYVYPDGVNPILYGAVGLADAVDVYFGAGTFIAPGGPATSALELFPRFFVDPSVALSPHLYWTPGSDTVIVAPEVHVNHSWSRFAIVANAGWRPVLGGTDGFSAGTVPVIVAPELRLAERYSMYVELDPTFALDGGDVAMIVVPGFGAALDASGRHAVSVGLQIPVLPEVGPASLGAFYCVVFPSGGEGSE